MARKKWINMFVSKYLGSRLTWYKLRFLSSGRENKELLCSTNAYKLPFTTAFVSIFQQLNSDSNISRIGFSHILQISLAQIRHPFQRVLQPGLIRSKIGNTFRFFYFQNFLQTFLLYRKPFRNKTIISGHGIQVRGGTNQNTFQKSFDKL